VSGSLREEKNMRHASRRAFGVVACAALSLTACVTITPEQEVDLGRSYADQINQQLPLIADEDIQGYVSEEALKVARSTARPDLPYEFQVVNTSDLNAFALPGGYVYINRGIIEQSSNMAEVMGVLSHEIGHVVARHSVKQLEAAQRVNTGLTLGSLIFGAPRGAAATAINLGGGLYFSKHSRQDESEADSLAVGFMMNAGWDPRALVSFFQKMLSLRQTNPGLLDALFASHPVTEDRIRNVTRIILRIPDAKLQGLRLSTPEYVRMKEAVDRLPPPPKQTRNQM